MEAFSFELKLISDVDRVARRGADDLKRLGATAQKTQHELNFSKPLERAEAALHRLERDPAGFIKMKKAQKELAEQQKKLLDGFGLKGKSFGEVIGEKFSLAKIAGGAAIGGIIAEGVIKAGETLIETAHKFAEIIVEGAKKAFEESGGEEKRRRQFRLSLGAEGGKEALEDAERFSKLTKFTPEQIAPVLLKLRRAGYDEKSARQTIATGSDIEAAGGLKMQEFADFAEHLKLKGGVSTKQLVNAGINAPQFYKDLGKKLKISAEEAEKRAEAGGKIDPQLMLNQITEAVNKRQGGRAGTGGADESRGFEARMAKLFDLPNQYLKRLVNSPGFAQASEAFGRVLDRLDPDSENGRRIIAKLQDVFEKITSWIEEAATPEGIDSMVSGFESVATVVEAVLGFVRDTVAEVNKLIDGVKVLSDIAIAATGGGGAVKAVKELEEKYKAQKRTNEQVAKSQEVAERAVSPLADVAGAPGPYAAGPVVNEHRSSSKSSSTKIINLHVHPGAVSVHAAPGESPDRSHREAGAQLHRHVTRELERAAQEGGG